MALEGKIVQVTRLQDGIEVSVAEFKYLQEDNPAFYSVIAFQGCNVLSDAIKGTFKNKWVACIAAVNLARRVEENWPEVKFYEFP